MKFLFKKKIFIPLILIVIALGAWFFLTRNNSSVQYVTAKIEKGDLIQTVSETGTVKAAKEIDLNFLQTGKISKIFFKAGDKVAENQILAELDFGALNIKKQEAEASLEIARSNLAKLLEGVTREEIIVSESNVGKAEAAYNSAQVELNKIKQSIAETVKQAEKTYSDLSSSEQADITPYEQAIITAQINLNNTKATYQKSVDDYKDSLLLAVESKLSLANTALDNIDTILSNNDANGYLGAKSPIYVSSTISSYDDGKILCTKSKNSLLDAKINSADSNLKIAVNDSIKCLNKVLESLGFCYSALENSITAPTFTQTTLDAYKTTINSQITNINTAISLIQTADQNLSNAKLAYITNVSSKEDSLKKAQVDYEEALTNARNRLSSAQTSGEQQIAAANSQLQNAKKSWEVSRAQLSQLKSPPRSEDLSLQRAQVRQAEASLDLINKQIDDSLIKAPISGIIIDIAYEVGEQVNGAKPVIKMLGENNFELEVDISEADIAKIRINDSADITLDSFGQEIKFYGKVYFIEPAETVIQDVIYYKVKISFNEDNKRLSEIKSGMTANIIITTDKKENILVAPSRAIIEKNGDGKFIRILKDKQLIESPVQIGLRGDGGMVELISGAKEGDEVVTYVNEKK